ncbi:MAG: MCE family protein [Burkholderiales bacterium]|nr:MCE family protein [Burkholderiales bacterium]
METKVNYTIVGIFVILLGIALVAGVIWLGAGAEYRKSYDRYLVYMNESVAGLNPNAPVRYRGVLVGKVKDISIEADRPESVRLLLEIEKGMVIRRDTVATLKSQGLTGIAAVELSGGKPDSPVLVAKDGEKYPVIHSEPSLMTRLDTAVTPILAHLDESIRNLNSTFGEDNRKHFSESLTNLAKLSDVLARRSKEIDSGLKNASSLIANGEKASASLPMLVSKFDRAAEDVQKMARDVRRSSEATRKTVGHMDDTMPEFRSLVSKLQNLSDSLERLSRELERNPSLLLYGRSAGKPGPGE